MLGLHPFLGVLAVWQPGLDQVRGERAQSDHLPRVESSRQHQPIQSDVLGFVVPGLQEGGFEIRALPLGVQNTVADQLHAELLDPRRIAILGTNLVRVLRDNAQAEVLQRRDRKRTRLNSSHYCASRLPSSACKKTQTNT